MIPSEQRFHLEIDPPTHGFKVCVGVAVVHFIMGFMLIQMGSSAFTTNKSNLVNPLLFSEIQVWDENSYEIVQLKSMQAMTLGSKNTVRDLANPKKVDSARVNELANQSPSVGRTTSHERLNEADSDSSLSRAVQSTKQVESQSGNSIAGDKLKPLNEGNDSPVVTSNVINPFAATPSKDEGGNKVTLNKVTGLSLMRSPSPEYPELSRRNGEQGVVWVAIQVNAQGIPIEVQLKQTSGFNRLDQAALRGVKNWRFSPQSPLPGEHVHHVDVPVVFKISNL